MSGYVFPEDQQAPMDYVLDLDFDFDQFIDPALLSMHALDTDQVTAPAGQGLRPFEAGQSGRVKKKATR
jgi:hypothetical protein